LGGSEGVMPNRANSFVPALFAGSLFAGSLATTVLLGLSVTASDAAECFESPQRKAEPGHWYYHSDRPQGKRCWFFEPTETRSAEAMTSQPATPAPNEGSPPSLFSQLAAGFSQNHAPPSQQSVPQQTSIPDESAEVARTASPKPPKATKVSKRERPQETAAPPPATSSAASAEQHDHPSTEQREQAQPPAAAKSEKQQQPADVVEREALFQDFMKWQQERAVFGTRWP
jgi:hypothetical protein